MIPEQELASKCATGDKLAQRELYMCYAAKIKALCYRYIGDENGSADMMHDAMIKAYGSIRKYQYQGAGSLYAWLKRLTVNLIIDQIRKKKIIQVSLEEVSEYTAAEPDEASVQSIPAEVIATIITRLPKSQRWVFNLYCIDGYSHKEISKMLGISEKGSASLLAKARRQLRESLIDYIKNPE